MASSHLTGVVERATYSAHDNVLQLPTTARQPIPLQPHRGPYPRGVVPGHKLVAKRKARHAQNTPPQDAGDSRFAMRFTLGVARKITLRETDSAEYLPPELRRRLQEICQELESIEEAVERL